MINELDDVILTSDLPEHGLSAGDIGTVVLVHRNVRARRLNSPPWTATRLRSSP